MAPVQMTSMATWVEEMILRPGLKKCNNFLEAFSIATACASTRQNFESIAPYISSEWPFTVTLLWTQMSTWMIFKGDKSKTLL